MAKRHFATLLRVIHTMALVALLIRRTAEGQYGHTAGDVFHVAALIAQWSQPITHMSASRSICGFLWVIRAIMGVYLTFFVLDGGTFFAALLLGADAYLSLPRAADFE